MPKVRFAIPKEFLSDFLVTKTAKWLDEESLPDFSFSFNKDLDEIPIKLENSFYAFSRGIVLSDLYKEKLDRVLETIKLHLKTTEALLKIPCNFEVISEEVVSTVEPIENNMDSLVVDFVAEAILRLSVMSLEEQNWAMKELYIRVQKNRKEHIEQLEKTILEVKETSSTLYEILSKIKPTGFNLKL